MIKLSMATLLLASVAPAALAQTAAQSTNKPSSKSDGVVEVVVTAQKRSESVQTVPIAITAFSGNKLADKAVSTLTDLQFAAPSLSVENAGLTQSVNIRGIGLSSGSPNAANGVATYVDGLFQPPIVSGGSYYDIADIEVLRGPQGTFVGSNSTGGAIFVNTQSPKLNNFGGYAELGGGSYSASLAQGAINIPIGSKLAVRVAINSDKHDSYYTDQGPYHNQPGKLDELADRVGILWQPASFYSATVKWSNIRRQTGGYAYQPVPGTAFGGSLPAGASTDDVYYNAPTKGNEFANQGSLEQKITLPGNITLKSITGEQDKKIKNLYDTDASLVANNTEDQYVREREYSQEIDLLSPTDGRFSWIAGGYYQRNRIDVDIHNGAFPTHINIHNAKITTGVFGQASYKLTPTLTATFGLRNSNYRVTSTGFVNIGAGIPGFPPSGVNVANLAGFEKDQALTGKFDIDWAFAPSNMLYAFAARGYKSGGIIDQTHNFKKETVWNYEVGWKSGFFGQHIKTQLDVFYNDYNNFQFDTVNTSTGQGTIQNVPAATIAGLEASAQGRFGNFSFDGALSYVHSRLGAYTVVDQNLLPPGTLLPQCATGQTTGCTDYTNALKHITGAPNLLSPDWTYNFGAEYRFSLGHDYFLTPRLNYAYQASQQASPTLAPFYQIAARGLLSALVSLDHNNWRFQVRATNLLDKKYITGFSVNGSSGNQFYGAPREIMAVVTRNF